MQYTTLLSAALTTFAVTSAQTTSPSTIVDLYPNVDCPGSDPLAQPPPEFFQDGLCHSLGSAGFKSAQVTLTFQGANQIVKLFEDEACTTETLELRNDGNTTGQCRSDDKGWRGFIYLTYR